MVTPHKSSKEEIANLLEIVERDLKDASQESISSDWKFGIAYNAALKLCTILLHSSGHRAEKNLAHFRTLQSLPLVLGTHHRDNADYLDVCRKKRMKRNMTLREILVPKKPMNSFFCGRAKKGSCSLAKKT